MLAGGMLKMSGRTSVAATRPVAGRRQPPLCQLIGLLLVAQFSLTVDAYSSASFNNFTQACEWFWPAGHLTLPQSTPSPYVIELSRDYYEPGDSLQVFIRTTNGTPNFKGFILQARVNFTGAKVGEFDTLPGTRQNCEPFGGKTLSHSNSNGKNTLNITWHAPLENAGDVMFRATIVQEYFTYWPNISSPVVRGMNLSGTLPPQASEGTVAPVTQDPLPEVDVSTCGVSKGCYKVPGDCGTDMSCDFLVTWRRSGPDTVDFQTQATLTADHNYLALGFSYDNSMGLDSVVDCIYTGDPDQPFLIQMSYNTDNNGFKGNEVLSQHQLGLVTSQSQGYYADGRITCHFTRLISVSNDSLRDVSQVYDLDQDMFLLQAKGVAFGGVKTQHTDQVVAPAAVNTASEDYSTLTGVAHFPLVKAHGILMIFSWMVCVSFAVLLPRYFKSVWPDKTCCGKAIWFQMHQPLMIIALLLTSAGFICIFVEAGGYLRFASGPAVAHPAMGILTLCLVYANPLIAAGRCHPDHPKRPIFNWLHFSVGTLGHACGVTTMFLGVYMVKANMPFWAKWIMVAFICWHAVIEMTLAILTHTGHKQKEPQRKPTPLSAVMVHVRPSQVNFASMAEIMDAADGTREGINETQEVEKVPHAASKTAILCLHACVILGLAISLFVPLGRGY